jgi:hypothetical protein
MRALFHLDRVDRFDQGSQVARSYRGSIAPLVQGALNGSSPRRIADALGADTYVQAPAATMRPALIAAKKPFQSFSVWFP